MSEYQYTPEELYDLKYVRVTTEHWDSFASFTTRKIYPVAGLCTPDEEDFHLDTLVIYDNERRTIPVWIGWIEPAFDSASPTKEEVEMMRMLGYSIPTELEDLR